MKLLQKHLLERDNIGLWIIADRSTDQHHYNLPTTAAEIAAIIPGDGSEECSDHRDIILRLHQGGLQRISHLHPAYSSLHYVLLFPYGENGWHPNIPAEQGGAPGNRRSNKVSQRCYYAYHLHI